MRIAVVAGADRSLVNFRGPLLKDIVRAGHSVTACAPQLSPEVQNVLIEMGVSPCQIPLKRTGVNVVSDMHTLQALRRTFARLRPDLVFAYTIKPVVYGSLAARMAGVEKVASMITGLGYTFGTDTMKQRLLRPVAQRLYRVALGYNSVVFFQNPDDKDLFIRNGLIKEPDKAVLINGSGVDLNRFFKASPVIDGPKFLLIARLIRTKGIAEYVEAARVLKRKYSTARFRLLGPFDDHPSAISPETIERWEKEGVIEYLGQTNDIRPYMADTSVYVLPSYREGTPRTVLEAMAMGRPVVTTNVSGCRETVVHGRNGFLVPVKDVGSLASAMERFILEPDLIPAMGEESYKIACLKYDVRLVNRVILSALGL